MNKQNTLLILWIVLGFSFITAIDSILYTLTYLIYFVKSELGIPYSFMNISMPITSFIMYFTTAYILCKKVIFKSRADKIYLTKFPSVYVIILLLLIFGLVPITNKLIAQYWFQLTELEDVNMSSIANLNGWIMFGIKGSGWFVLLGLLIIYWNQLKEIEYTNPNNT